MPVNPGDRVIVVTRPDGTKVLYKPDPLTPGSRVATLPVSQTQFAGVTSDSLLQGDHVVVHPKDGEWVGLINKEEVQPQCIDGDIEVVDQGIMNLPFQWVNNTYPSQWPDRRTYRHGMGGNESNLIMSQSAGWNDVGSGYTPNNWRIIDVIPGTWDGDWYGGYFWWEHRDYGFGGMPEGVVPGSYNLLGAVTDGTITDVSVWGYNIWTYKGMTINSTYKYFPYEGYPNGFAPLARPCGPCDGNEVLRECVGPQNNCCTSGSNYWENPWLPTSDYATICNCPDGPFAPELCWDSGQQLDIVTAAYIAIGGDKRVGHFYAAIWGEDDGKWIGNGSCVTIYKLDAATKAVLKKSTLYSDPDCCGVNLGSLMGIAGGSNLLYLYETERFGTPHVWKIQEGSTRFDVVGAKYAGNFVASMSRCVNFGGTASTIWCGVYEEGFTDPEPKDYSTYYDQIHVYKMVPF